MDGNELEWPETRPFISLIIPVYNECFRIAGTIKAAQAYLDSLDETWELIVVDDGSTDGTLDAVYSLANDSSRMRVVSYQYNRGKGYAVRQGVLVSKGHMVAFSDADLSAPLEELPKLIAAIKKGYDIAIGSRSAKGSQLEAHQPLYRELGGKCLNLVIQALAVPGIRDTQCGFKLFRGDMAREIFSRCFIDGWGFDIEVLYLARKAGHSIVEVGVRWSHAEGSKIRPFQAGLRVLWDIMRIRAHKYELPTAEG